MFDSGLCLSLFRYLEGNCCFVRFFKSVPNILSCLYNEFCNNEVYRHKWTVMYLAHVHVFMQEFMCIYSQKCISEQRWTPDSAAVFTLAGPQFGYYRDNQTGTIECTACVYLLLFGFYFRVKWRSSVGQLCFIKLNFGCNPNIFFFRNPQDQFFFSKSPVLP